MNGDLNLPFEPQEPTPALDDFALSGGVVVMSALVPTGDGLEPMIVFRFAHADGSGFMPPIALGFEADQVDDFTLLIRQAMERALEAAR
jgi:hypothetical protein